MYGLAICTDPVSTCTSVCVAENACADLGCRSSLDVSEAITVCAWTATVPEVEGELTPNIFVSGEAGPLGSSDGENPESVDRSLLNATGEGKVDPRGEVAGGDDDGGRGSSGDCLKDVKSKLSSEVRFTCVVELPCTDGCLSGTTLTFCTGCTVFTSPVDFSVVSILKSAS